MSELLAIGVSHKTAPVEVRERLALPEPRAAEFMRDLRGGAEVHEAVAVSTCNRTELYLVVGDPVEAESTVLSMLARLAGIRPTELAGAIYAHRNCDAARHLYRVVSGLESMLIGEAEIKANQARAEARGKRRQPARNTPAASRRRTGHRQLVYRTAIGEGQLSLPGAAVALAREQLGELRGRRVVIIGTGETSELTGRVHQPGCQRRHGVRGQPPARPGSQPRSPLRLVSGRAAPRRWWPPTSSSTATASPLAWRVREIADVMHPRPQALIAAPHRPRRPPPDIGAAALRRVDGVTLFDIDDLQAGGHPCTKNRRMRAHFAPRIIEEGDEIRRLAQGSLGARPGGAARRAGADIRSGWWPRTAAEVGSASPRDLGR